MPLVLAGMNPVVLGLLALAIIIGASLIAQFIGRLLEGGIPLPGINVLAGVVTKGLHLAINALNGLLTAIARGAVVIIMAIPFRLAHLAESIYIAIASHIELLRMLFTQAVPALYRAVSGALATAIAFASDLANRLFNQALAYATSIRAYLVGLINSSVAWLRSLIDSVYRTLSQALAAAIANVTAYALGLYHAAVQFANNGLNVLANRLNAAQLALQAYALSLAHWAVDAGSHIAIDWARRYADQVMGALARTLDATAGVAVAPAWPHILDAIDSLSLAVPESVAAVLARVGAFPRAIPRTMDASMAGVAAAAAVAVDYVAKCGVSLCKNTKRFGDELDALGDAAMMAVIFEMLIDAIRDPDGAAGDTIGSLHGPLVSAVEEFGDAIGIRL